MGTFVPFRIIPRIRGCAFVFSDSEVEPNANERKMEDEEGRAGLGPTNGELVELGQSLWRSG